MVASLDVAAQPCEPGLHTRVYLGRRVDPTPSPKHCHARTAVSAQAKPAAKTADLNGPTFPGVHLASPRHLNQDQIASAIPHGEV